MQTNTHTNTCTSSWTLTTGFVHLGFNSINHTVFTYNERIGQSRDCFYEPNYTPLFSFNTNDLSLELVCGNDTFCMFDVASTGRTDIGLTTLNAGREYEEILELLLPSMHLAITPSLSTALLIYLWPGWQKRIIYTLYAWAWKTISKNETPVKVSASLTAVSVMWTSIVIILYPMYNMWKTFSQFQSHSRLLKLFMQIVM